MSDPIGTAPGEAPGEAPATDAMIEAAAEQRTRDLESRLVAAEAEVARLNEEFLRARAEADNTRRRAAEDVTRAHKFGIESFATSLLAVRDSLEAALAVPTPTVESLRQGVEITAKQLATAFEKALLAEVSPQGEKFDPHFHQALSEVASDQTPNTVVAVVQKGYRLHDRVIRPALVMVARPPAGAPPGPPGA